MLCANMTGGMDSTHVGASLLSPARHEVKCASAAAPGGAAGSSDEP